MPQPATSSLSRTALRTEPECSASTRRLRLCKLARSAPHCLQRGSTHSCGVIPPPRSVRRRISSTATRGSLSERASTAAGLPSATRGCAPRCRHLIVLTIPSSASCFSWSSTAHWVEPHTVTTPSVMSTAPTPGTPQFTARTWCVGVRELDIPPATHRLLHFKLLPGGESSVEPARLQPGCTI